MDKMIDLAEQHILESASRLRLIDEMMAKARGARLENSAAAQADARLRQLQSDRDRLAHELEGLQRSPRREGPDFVKRAEGLKGLLGSVGLQLEQLLAAVLERQE